MSYSIISKGKFNLPGISNFISLSQYLFVKEDGRKFLLLKLTNDREEKVNGVTLAVTQKNARGVTLGTLTVDCPVPDGNPHSAFVLGRKIALEDTCADFQVKILSAHFGNYVYTAQGNELVLSYKKQEYSKDIGGAPAQKTGGENHSVTVHSFKIPVAVCLFMLVALALTSFFTYAQLQTYIADTDTFFYSGVEYAFESADKSEDSRIYAVGSKSSQKVIVIPEKIKGHKVAGISKQAFSGNPVIEKVTIEGPVEIENGTFSGCTNLSVINMEKVTRIGDAAFYNTAISEFDGTNLYYIGNNAFFGCANLSAFLLDNNENLSYIGAGAFNSCTRLKRFFIPKTVNSINNGTFESCSSLTEVVLGGELQMIGDYAFSRCSSLREAPLSGQLMSVGREAFRNCVSLETLNFSQSLISIGDYAFAGCGRVKSVTVPKNVGRIGLGAFSECTAVLEMTLPFIGGSPFDNKFFAYIFGAVIPSVPDLVPKSLEKVTVTSAAEIGENAFYNCGYLKEIFIEGKFSRIGYSAFAFCKSLNNFVIPASVTQIDTDAFDGCYKLYEIYNLSRLPIVRESSGYGMAGYYALKVYESLDEERIAKFSYDGYEFARNDESKWYLINYTGTKTSISLPRNLYYNGSPVDSYEVIRYMMTDNSSVKNVSMSDAVTAIGDYAFSGCSVISSVEVSDSVSSVGFGAFSGCNSLQQITLPFVGGSPVSDRYLSYIFGSRSLSDSGWVPYALKTVTLTKGTDIPDQAFYNCGNITGITLPATLKSVGENAFRYCYQLAKIDLPSSVTTIGSYAFYDCTSLEKVSLFGDIDIKEKAFYGCPALHEVYNLGGMDIKEGSKENGYIAYYAVAVYTSLKDTPLEKVTIDGAVFKHYGQTWALVDYIGGASELKLSFFEYRGNTISSYSVKSRAFRDKSYPVSLIIGKEVAAIDEYAFSNCYNLKTVKFEASVITELSDYAFHYCSSLVSIDLSQGLTRIGNNAFSDCRQLYSIRIPESVTEIGDYAFINCFALRDVFNLSKSLPIQKGSPNNGYVAFYALRLATSADTAPLDTVTSGDCRFMLFEGQWHMISVASNSYLLSLPESITYNGTKISSYILIESALAGQYYNRIFIPRSVSSIQRDQSYYYYLSIDTIYYGGTAQEWAALIKDIPDSQLTQKKVYYNSKGV